MNDKLSRREEQVLDLYAQGFGGREIGEQLGITMKTVEAHKHHARIKLGCEAGDGDERYLLRKAAMDWYIEREVAKRLAKER